MKKKIISLLLAALLLASLLPMTVMAADYGNLEFTISEKDSIGSDGKSIEYENGYKLSVTYNEIGENSISTVNEHTELRDIPDRTEVTFTLTIPDGETTVPDLMLSGARESFEDNSFKKTLYFSQNNVIMVSLDFGNNPGPGGQEDGHIVKIQIENNDGANGSVLCKFDTEQDFTTYTTANYDNTGNIRLTIPEGAAKITFKAAPNESYAVQDCTIWCDDQDIDETKAYMNDVKGDGYEYTLTSDDNTIVFRASFGHELLSWHTVSWAGGNVKVENGQVNAYAVHIGDKIYDESVTDADETNKRYPLSMLTRTEGGSSDTNSLLEEYGVAFCEGTDLMIADKTTEAVSVDFRFIPDYGYQVTDIRATEDSLLEDFAHGTEISTFSFEYKPNTNVHFIVEFTKTDDIINSDGSSIVTDAVIENGGNATDSGNLMMTISDVNPENVSAGLSEQIGDNKAQYLNMTLSQVVSKTGEKGNWEKPLTEFEDEINVSLTVSDLDPNEEYIIIREHTNEDGSVSYDEIPVTYNSETSTITFATNKFSTYALVKKSAGECEEIPQPHNVTAQVQGSHGKATAKVGEAEATSETTQAVAGDSVVFTATPDTDYEFYYWEVVSGGITLSEDDMYSEELTVTMPDTALTLKAHFREHYYTNHYIIVEDDGHGTAKAQTGGTDVTGRVAPNTNVTLVATANEGYAFKEWQIIRGLEAGAITDNTFKMPSNEVKVKAIFERVYNINLQSDGHATPLAYLNDTDSVTTAKAGDSITLHYENLDEGYEFDAFDVVSGTIEFDEIGNTFVMPAENVTVRMTFKKTETPEPEGECEYTETVKLTEGTFGMKLGGKDVGYFKFTKVDGGWKIMKTTAPGMVGVLQYPYLAMQDGKLTYTNEANATVWTYKNGAFYTTVKTTQKNSGYWFGFLYIPGRGIKTVTTTYYLSTVTADEKLSTCYVCAELYQELTGEHEYGCWIDCKDGANHKRQCKHCGEWETKAHSYDNETHKCVCGAYDPAESSVKISVDVNTKTTKQFSGFLFWGTWKNVTTYTATIKTEATGVKVTKVQYQLNGSSKWTTGTSVSSSAPIETLKVKVTDNKGNVYTYEYPEDEGSLVATIPTVATGLVYNGTEQTGVAEGTGYTLTDNKATSAGNYTAIATLAVGYKWSDGSSEPKQIEWSIAKAEITSAEAVSQLYTGEILTPVLTVKAGELVLEENDYQVSTWDPDELKEVSTYTATVTGKGNFTGEIVVSFEIIDVEEEIIEEG